MLKKAAVIALLCATVLLTGCSESEYRKYKTIGPIKGISINPIIRQQITTMTYRSMT